MIKCIVVENRLNPSIEVCYRSFANYGVPIEVLASEDGGDEFEKFKANYVHKSTNPIDFELICFRRYFILNRFLSLNPSIDEFILVDSDLIVGRDFVPHILDVAAGKDFVGSLVDDESHELMMISPHVSYWTRRALHEFLNFLLVTYTSDLGIKQLEDIEYKFKSKRIRGGVTDMGLIYLWCYSNNNFHTINSVRNNRVIDHNLNVAHNSSLGEFKTIFGMKLVVFNKEERYFIRKDGVKIKCMAVHFQGRAKLLMPYFESGSVIKFYGLAFAISLARFFKNTFYRVFQTNTA